MYRSGNEKLKEIVPHQGQLLSIVRTDPFNSILLVTSALFYDQIKSVPSEKSVVKFLLNSTPRFSEEDEFSQPTPLLAD